MTFWGDAMVVGIPAQLPLHAIPNRIALAKGSDGLRVLIIGIARESVSVVDVTLERKDPMSKLRSIRTSKIIDGFGGTYVNIEREIRDVILSFCNAAVKTRLPRNNKIIGSVNLKAKYWASSTADILSCVALLMPILNQTARIGIKYAVAKGGIASVIQRKHTVQTIAKHVCAVGYSVSIGETYIRQKIKTAMIGSFDIFLRFGITPMLSSTTSTVESTTLSSLNGEFGKNIGWMDDFNSLYSLYLRGGPKVLTLFRLLWVGYLIFIIFDKFTR